MGGGGGRPIEPSYNVLSKFVDVKWMCIKRKKEELPLPNQSIFKVENGENDFASDVTFEAANFYRAVGRSGIDA